MYLFVLTLCWSLILFLCFLLKDLDLTARFDCLTLQCLPLCSQISSVLAQDEELTTNDDYNFCFLSTLKIISASPLFYYTYIYSLNIFDIFSTLPMFSNSFQSTVLSLSPTESIRKFKQKDYFHLIQLTVEYLFCLGYLMYLNGTCKWKIIWPIQVLKHNIGSTKIMSEIFLLSDVHITK